MSERIHFTLVHGTFAPDAPWTRPDSRLRRALASAFPGAVTTIFPWSGKNSISARYQASLELRNFLAQAQRKAPDARHFLITHSHGGTIALQAASSPEIGSKTAGVICLATPFISPRKRRSDAAYLAGTLAGTLAFAAIIIVATVRLVMRFCPKVRPSILEIGVFASLAIAASAPPFWLLQSQWYAARIEALNSKMRLPETVPFGVLLLRAFADEATGVLVAAHFATWVAELLWRVIVWPYKKYIAFEKKDQTKSGFIALFLSIAIASPRIIWTLWRKQAGLPVHNLPPWLFYAALLPVAIWALVHSVNIVFFLASALSFPLMVIIGIILAPVVGRELLWSSFGLDIAVEPTPPGSWNLTTFQVDERARTGLMHSSLYEDEGAIELICEWVRRTSQQIA